MLRIALLALLLVIAAAPAIADPALGVGGFPIATMHAEELAVAPLPPLPPSPVTHKLFIARWTLHDWANIGMAVGPGLLDACQTSCKDGFLRGPVLHFTQNGTNYTAVLGEGNVLALPCVGDGVFKNELCGIGVFVVGKGIVVEDWVVPAVFPGNYRVIQQDLGYATLGGIPIYYGTIVRHNNTNLRLQYDCADAFYDPFNGKCFGPSVPLPSGPSKSPLSR